VDEDEGADVEADADGAGTVPAAAAAAFLDLFAAAATAAAAAAAAVELTVDSCSWISIMWSPSLIVRLRGALPERKLFLDVASNKLSRNCIWTRIEVAAPSISRLLLRHPQRTHPAGMHPTRQPLDRITGDLSLELVGWDSRGSG
jgi:hypothetical protein